VSRTGSRSTAARPEPIAYLVTLVPSIKATLFQFASDDIAKLLESGRLTRGEIERRLPREDLAYLGKQLAASSWVPMATYERVSLIAIDLECGGERDGYLRKAGLRAAARLHKLGLYNQFEASSEKWGLAVGRILVTLATVSYNFMRWRFEEGDEHAPFRVILDEARDFPEILRVANEGFIAYFARHVLALPKAEVTSERVTPDRIVYTARVESAG
jgi:hypothetical protein